MPVVPTNHLDELTERRQELQNLNAAINERKRYYNEQKNLVNEMVEAGNTELMYLSYDIELARKQLRDLKTDIRTGIQDKVLLNEDLKELRLQIEVLIPNNMLGF